MRWPYLLLALELLSGCPPLPSTFPRRRVPLKPPGITIRAPSDGAIFFEGENVAFEARLYDPTGGIQYYEWRSNIDGVLTTMTDTPLINGDSLFSTTLSEGTHQIKLWAMDWNDMEADDAITLTVKPNHPPVVQIALPVDGSTHLASEPIALEGHVSDPDGLDDIASLEWRSDLDGVLTTIEETPLDAYGVSRFSIALSPGYHGLTLAVLDDKGLAGEHVVYVTVTE